MVNNQELHSFATGNYYYLKVEDELVKMGFAHSERMGSFRVTMRISMRSLQEVNLVVAVSPNSWGFSCSLAAAPIVNY